MSLVEWQLRAVPRSAGGISKNRVAMRSLVAVSAALASVLGCLVVATASAEDSPAAPDKNARAGSGDNAHSEALSSDPEDPQNLLPEIRDGAILSLAGWQLRAVRRSAGNVSKAELR